MSCNQFRRWLIEQGVEIKKGKKHDKLYFNGKRSTLPRHGSKELPTGTEKAIKEQLGL